MPRRINVAASLGRWSAGHRILAVTGWLLLVVVTMFIGARAGQVHMGRVEYGTGESGRAAQVLTDAGIAEPAQEMVLVHSATARAPDRAFQAAVRDVVSGVRATGAVRDIRTPAASATGHDVLVQFAMKGSVDTAYERVQPVLDAVARARAAHPDVTIEQFGDASANKWFNDTVGNDASRAEWTAVPVAIGILLVVFGALLAALLPVALALTAFLAANGVLAVISHAMHLDPSASSVMMLMGLAVGVDYSLFYLRRARDERAAGRNQPDSLAVAAATSGRSVLVSGLTVIVAMAGMFLSGMQLFAGFAIATIMVVLIAVVGSVTVLPALLSVLGDRVELGRIPLLRRRHPTERSGRGWDRIVRTVLARPALSTILATGFLLVLAVPALRLHTETLPIDKVLPASTPLVQTYERITTAFHGGPEPARVVLTVPDVRASEVTNGIAAFERAARASGRFGEPIQVRSHPGVGVVDISVPLAGSGSDATSRAALRTLHDTVVPPTLGAIPGAQALVGGYLAASLDFNHTLRVGIVPVFIFVLTITFLIMLVAFRSLLIPALTIGLNLLSVGAAYGALVAVFQYGWGAGLVDTTAPGAIESWIPLFVFVVLFGLSMDYHVFVVSRIKEAHDHGASTREAVAVGIRRTAGVVTSAAIIMVAVFAVFGTLSLMQFKQLSVGLAVAVLLDATVIRVVLLPSLMAMFGERNWYLPHWLSWLDRDRGTCPEPAPRPVAPPSEQPADRPAEVALTGR